MTAERNKPFQILWIEDEYRRLSDFRDQLRDELAIALKRSPESIAFREAPTVEAAEAVLTELKDQPPNVILLDLILPVDKAATEANPPDTDMNAGYFVWYELRIMRRWGEKIASVPIVVLTARGNPEYRAKVEDKDNLRWISKPALASEVVNAVWGLVMPAGQPGHQQHAK